MWTLALCKPAIRSQARVGDYVVAVWTKDLYGQVGLLHSVALVTAVQSLATYYGQRPVRRDQIYERMPDGEIRHRRNVRYHGSGPKEAQQRQRDMQGAVLLSRHFRVFDASDPPEVDADGPLRGVVRHAIGHVKGTLEPDAVADLERLIYGREYDQIGRAHV